MDEHVQARLQAIDDELQILAPEIMGGDTDLMVLRRRAQLMRYYHETEQMLSRWQGHLRMYDELLAMLRKIRELF
jgi:hypothetical protein